MTNGLPSPATNAESTAAGDVSAVIARAYVSADPKLKARMIDCLTRPLGVLSRVPRSST